MSKMRYCIIRPARKQAATASIGRTGNGAFLRGAGRPTAPNSHPSSKPITTRARAIRQRIGDPIHSRHMGQGLQKIQDPHNAARKAIFQPLQNPAAAHPAPDEQEQRGNQGVSKYPIDSEGQRHRSVFRENTGGRTVCSPDGMESCPMIRTTVAARPTAKILRIFLTALFISFFPVFLK